MTDAKPTSRKDQIAAYSGDVPPMPMGDDFIDNVLLDDRIKWALLQGAPVDTFGTDPQSNLETLIAWEDAHKPKPRNNSRVIAGDLGEERKRHIALKCLARAENRLSALPLGERDDGMGKAIKDLAKFYNEGHLSEAEIRDAMVRATIANVDPIDGGNTSRISKAKKDVPRCLAANSDLRVDNWGRFDWLADDDDDTHVAKAETNGQVSDFNPNDGDEPLYSDIGAVLDGTKTAPTPTILTRVDGHALFYRGEMNYVYGDPEDGKTWLALAAAAPVLCAGGKVIFTDLDDNGGAAIIERLRLLGVPDHILRNPNVFRHTQPDDANHMMRVVEDCAKWKPDIVVIDSVGELIPLFKGNSDNSDQYTDIIGRTVRPLVIGGACGILLDHLAKSADSRAYGAGGTMAKRRKLGGTSIRVKAGRAFRRGHGGTVRLYVAKDRHGGVRQHCGPGREPDCGVFVLDGGADPGWRVIAPLATLASDPDVAYLAAARDLTQSPFTVRALAEQYHSTAAPTDAQKEDTRRAVERLAVEGGSITCVFAGQRGKGGESLWQLR